ncbi:MAG: hypothetical protein ACTTKL_09920 [Treponema sp.]
MENTKRTVTCGALTAADAGKNVILNGWVLRTRELGGLTFNSLIFSILFNSNCFIRQLIKASYFCAAVITRLCTVFGLNLIKPKRFIPILLIAGQYANVLEAQFLITSP